MIVAAYCETVQNFRAEIKQNSWITHLQNGYQKVYGMKPSPSEVNSWNSSHPELAKLLTNPNLDDCMIVLEAQSQIKNNRKRIDVAIMGKNTRNQMQLIVVELKAWSVVKPSPIPDRVETILGGGYRDTDHPSTQANEYVELIKFSEPSCDKTHTSYCINTSGFAYLHNMPDPPHSDALDDPQFFVDVQAAPFFLASEHANLKATLEQMLCKGDGHSIWNLISNSNKYISRNLANVAKANMPGTPLFNLIGKQVSINRRIQRHLNNITSSKGKQVIVIDGGPGSGKTAIGIQSLLTAITNGKTDVAFCARNAGFVAPLRKILKKTHLSSFIFYPFTFATPFKTASGKNCGSQDDSFDLIVADEAHRLPIKITKYNAWDIPKAKLSPLNTAEDIIRSSRVSVFIIDEKQVVNPDAVDTATILKAAKKQGATISTFKLDYQFRCGGSSRFVEWVEAMMYPSAQNPNFKLSSPTEPMQFNIINDPNDFKTMVAGSKKNDIRMVAGWCWKWNKPIKGVLPLDVKIDNHATGTTSPVSFSAPFEDKNRAASWAIRPDAKNEVGTIYTIQGLDFDRVCLIWPLDLQWNKKTQQWTGMPGRRTHKSTTKTPPLQYDNWDRSLKDLDGSGIAQYLINAYYVLLTRANIEMHVYFMHEDTKEYFEKWL
jgi:uncharacterized protein